MHCQSDLFVMDGSSKKAELRSTLIQELATGLKHFANSSTQPLYSSGLNFIFPLCFSGGAYSAASIPAHAACSCRFCSEIYKLLFKPCFSEQLRKKSVIRRGEELMHNLMLNKLFNILSSIQLTIFCLKRGKGS